ncbi:uncharacterized protein UTRI_10045 [Ustilago trichophora]|uniref:C3H1-type domain-containing protein n=1 Tax=Ustilago trichophora TaxID=86804 RepID=A0A5C3DWA7_9BASI|nr:uncharacterized protein UTRI_10045 [Ustilago trichophora]
MAVSNRRTCTKCSQSFPIDHFRGRANRSCRHCASCRNVPTEGLSSPFSPVQPPIPLAITSPVVAASASTTHALEPSAPPAPSTTLAGASPLAVPLQPLPYLTEASPAFLRLQQQLDDQGSSLSGISNALQQLLASSRPQPPTAPLPSTPQRAPAAPSLPAPTDSTSATGCHHLGAPSPGESDTNRIFSWLSREVVQQVLDDSLAPQDLGKLCNPDSLPVDSEDDNAVFVNGVLIRAAPSSGSSSSTRSFLRLVPDVRCFAEAWTVYTHLRSCATNDPNLGAGLGAFLIHIIETDRTHTWSSVALYILTTCRRRFGHASAAVWAQQDQNAWNQHLSTAASFRQPKKTTQQPPSNRLTQQQQQQPQQQPQGPPSKRQKSAEVCFRFNGGGCPEGDNCWRRHECTACSERHPPPKPSSMVSPPLDLPALPRRERGSRTPPLQGSARHLDGQTGLLAPRPPPLQGLARLSPDPAGSTSSRTPPLQGSARPLDSVPAALDVPSADRCLSLLLAAWLRDPGPRPNTSFVADVFDPTTNPARQGSMQERSQAWSTLLHLYPDPVFRRQLLGMVQHGCLLGYDGPLRGADRHCANLPIPPAGHSHLRMEIDARLAEGRLSIMAPGTALVESPIGVVPKPRSTKLRTIHHLSHPRRPLPDVLPSVNSGIQPGFIQIRYEGLGDLLTFVSQHPGCLLWKGDLEDAFRHIVTAEPDAHLLGFSYEGIRYRENALTFGGSSSPWLFNLVAEFLHWLVAACLPTGWPVNHYLDDTFGAVPASAAELALLPIHTLALAANTLGLRLSPKKTFGGVTKLEILGVEIDSVAQTVSISNIRRARILLQCQGLLQRRSADLLDMQRIAGLLQFVSQVFPCGQAFLRRLYDATRRGSQGRRHLSQPVRAELSWWCQILQSWSGTSVLAPSPLLATHIWTDACPKGYGGFVGDASSPSAVFARQVPKRHRRKNIRFLEALAVLEALRRFVHLLPASSLVVVHVDNENVEHGLRSGRSRDPLTQRLLREIFGFCFTHNLTLAPQQVSSTDNVLADLLSRRQFSRIQQQFPRAHAALSFPLAPAQSCRNPLVLPPASASPTTPRPSSGTASPSAPGDVRAAHPPISEPSASAITVLAPSASLPPVTSSWNGWPTCPPRVAPSTLPSTSLVPFALTMSTSASTPPASPADALSAPFEGSSAFTALEERAPSYPSCCRSSAGSSLPSSPCSTSFLATALSSKPPLHSPSLVSSAPANLSGTPARIAPPSCPSHPLRGPATTSSSPYPLRRQTPSGKASGLLRPKLAASSAPSTGCVPSRQAALPRHPSLALGRMAPSLSLAPFSLASSVEPCRQAACRRRSMPAIPSAAVLPPGRPNTGPRPRTSSPWGAGAQTATAGTSSAPLTSVALSLPRPCSPSATAPWSQPARPGGTQARHNSVLLAPSLVETAVSCAGASTTDWRAGSRRARDASTPATYDYPNIISAVSD